MSKTDSSQMTQGGAGASIIDWSSGHIAVERGVAEFRAGRPVIVAATNSIVAFPVDALDASSFRLFKDEWSAASGPNLTFRFA